MDLYVELFRIVSQITDISRVIHVWFGEVPCSLCIDYLDWIFAFFTVKPVLHIESLQYNGSNYNLLNDIGCLAKLRSRKYSLMEWNWTIFGTTYSESCNYYYSAVENHMDYMKQKVATKTLMDFLGEDLTGSSLTEFCHL